MSIVEREVNPEFEQAAVTRAVQRAGENAVLFRNVSGTPFQVVSNLYGSHDRIRKLIGAPRDGFCRRWKELVQQPLEHAACEEVAMPDDLVCGKMSDLPLITYHEKDAGPYFTSAIYLAKEPDTGVPNLSFHRSMYVSDEELRVRLGSSHDMTRYQRKAEERAQPMDAALLIGTSPEIFLAACASLPYEVNELEVAAKIAGAPIKMRPCRTVDLMVPADTEVVVEGRFLPATLRPEGPFGEFMGNYVPVGNNHVFQVFDVTWRQGAIFHSLTCGSNEDLRPLEAMTAARVYDHVSRVVPGVIDVSCRPNCMISIIKIKKQYEGHGKQVLLAAIGSIMDYNKVVIAVDEDVDIHDLDDVMWAYMVRGPADKRAFVINDVPGFYRDEMKDHWGRLAIDATMPWGREKEFERKSIPGEDDIDLSQYIVS
ncbi:MAG: UbiD family decarboxylase [Saprospiraceae bacterium]|nr:UbiD family decarboxylase [Saprospiraceae bacterium]